MMIETVPVKPIHCGALISLIFSILTALSFCAGFAPIPFTAILCYPISIVFGFVSLISGYSSLKQIRASGERGRAMALISLWIGALTILAVICLSTGMILLFPYVRDSIQHLFK